MSRSERSEFMEAWSIMSDLYSIYVNNNLEGKIVLDTEVVDFLTFAESFVESSEKYFGHYVAAYSIESTKGEFKLLIETGKLGFYASMQFAQDKVEDRDE